MTLHKAVEITRKFLIGAVIGLASLFVIMLLFRLGIIIKNIIIPPETQPANFLYGEIPDIVFPESTNGSKLTYEINTVSGSLPEFPDRINVYQLIAPKPSLLNLDKTKEKIKRLGFVDESGSLLKETVLGNDNYLWAENTNLGRRITINSLTSDFALTSNFLSLPGVLNSNQSPTRDGAIKTVTNFLTLAEIPLDDIDFAKSKVEFYSIDNGRLIPENNLSKAKIARIDLVQKNLEFDLDTGIPDLTGGYKKIKMDLPIMYSFAPYTTMSFLVGKNEDSEEIVKANFVHKIADTANKNVATYNIKNAEQAFKELQEGKAFVATYVGLKSKVTINNIYLAYYLDDKTEKYLMPIIVFEGTDGFLAYVSALRIE